jgi:hypothetical protein
MTRNIRDGYIETSLHESKAKNFKPQASFSLDHEHQANRIVEKTVAINKATESKVKDRNVNELDRSQLRRKNKRM